MVREEDPPRPSHRLSSSSNGLNSEVSDLRRMHPARLQRLLQGELDWVVMKALEKDRTRRYQSATDFAQDLSNYLTGATVAARPPSTWYQIQKFAQTKSRTCRCHARDWYRVAWWHCRNDVWADPSKPKNQTCGKRTWQGRPSRRKSKFGIETLTRFRCQRKVSACNCQI